MVLQRNKSYRRQRNVEIYFKELAYPVVELVSLKSTRRASSPETPTGLLCYSLEIEFSAKTSLLRPSTDWMMPRHIMKGNLYLKLLVVDVNHVYKIPSDQCLLD